MTEGQQAKAKPRQKTERQPDPRRRREQIEVEFVPSEATRQLCVRIRETLHERVELSVFKAKRAKAGRNETVQDLVEAAIIKHLDGLAA
jgi:hypothetical protein